jgi:hypothetical protein
MAKTPSQGTCEISHSVPVSHVEINKENSTPFHISDASRFVGIPSLKRVYSKMK